MVERLRASLRMFERMLEVEEQEAFHDAATASAEKLEGESSPAFNVSEVAASRLFTMRLSELSSAFLHGSSLPHP